MIRQGRFGTFEAVSLLLWATVSKIYLSYSSEIIRENTSAAWLVVFIGCLVAFLWFLPLAALLKRFPGQDIVSIAEAILGSVIGKILAGFIVLFLFASTALVLRQISETVIGTALPQFPLTLLAVTFALVIALIGFLGLESTARISALLTPFLLMGGIALFLIQYQHMNPNYLAPRWGPGLKSIAVNSFMHGSILSELILLGFIAPFLNSKKTFKTGMFLIISATILLVGAMLITQMIFPPTVASETTYPFYEIARSIYFGRFYQRVEFIFILVWLTITLLSMSLHFYFTTIGIARVLHMPHYQPLIGMTALAVLGASLLIPDFIVTIHLDNLLRGHWSWAPAFGIPFILYITALLSGKRGTQSV